MQYDLATQDVMYQKEVHPPMTMAFMNNRGRSEPLTTIPGRTTAHEFMIDEITILIRIRPKDKHALAELGKHLSNMHSKYTMEYKSDVPAMFDFSNGRVNWPEPDHAIVKIESGNIPYGFLSKYQKDIISIDVIFASIPYRTWGSTYYSGGYVAYSKPINIFPYSDMDLYFDKEFQRPFAGVFVPKSNKEAKKQARLQSIED